MKTTFIKKMATLALSVFALGSFAQCPTITSLYVNQGNGGVATIAAVMSNSVSSLQGHYYWTISPAAQQTSQSYNQETVQFYSNGTYTVCVNYNDSINMCTASTCSLITITTATASSCNASFTSYIDSSCVSHMTNTSIGSGLTYKWYSLPGFTLLSTQQNPSFNLPQGNNQLALYTYSFGQFCDSATSVIYVPCTGGTSSCNAAFSFSTNPSTCMTNFTSSSTGTNLTYQWRNMSSMALLSTQPNFSANLGSSNQLVGLYVYSNGQFCDSTMRTVGGCGTGTTSCNAHAQFAIFSDSLHTGNYFAYNQSSGSGTVSYLWNFGDGGTSTQAYPFHQYSTPGQYVVCLTVTATSGSITCTDTYCDSSSVHRISSAYAMNSLQVIASPTGIQEQNILKNLSVYPNPVENELTIEIERAQTEEQLSYMITDALGKTVSKNELTSSKTVINTAQLDKGIYFLSIVGSNKILKTTKLVK